MDEPRGGSGGMGGNMGLDGDMGRVSRAGPRTEDGDMSRGQGFIRSICRGGAKDRNVCREIVRALPSCPWPRRADSIGIHLKLNEYVSELI